MRREEVQEGGKQTAERQGRARMTSGKLSVSAKKVCFKLRVASVIDTHAFTEYRPNSVSGGRGMDCYFPLC